MFEKKKKVIEPRTALGSKPMYLHRRENELGELYDDIAKAERESDYELSYDGVWFDKAYQHWTAKLVSRRSRRRMQEWRDAKAQRKEAW